MKKFNLYLLFTMLCLVNTAIVNAQTGVAINTTGSSADASAMLDVSSTSKGLLLPRVTTVQRDAIVLPATSLVIFNTTVNSLQVNIGTPASPVWSTISPTTNDWSTTGNSGTNSGSNFLGTIDNKSLSIRTYNTERIFIDSLGHVGIGTSSFDPTNPGRLLVDYGTTTSNTVANFKGSIDNYFQLQVQNKSNGDNASSDFVATADNGTDSTFYIDMGINSSTYGAGKENFGGPNDGYIYTYGGSLIVGVQTANQDMLFLLGGGSIKKNTAMRIMGNTGNVVIGTGEGTALAAGNTVRGANAGGANIGGGTLTLQGGSATGNGTGGSVNITGGTSTSGTGGSVNINAGLNFATNINTGTSNQNVTVGGGSNNILFPKFTTIGGLIYTAAATGQIGSITPGTSGYVLQSNGAGSTPSWINPASSFWSLTGNTGTSATTNFIGTADAIDFIAKTNGIERLRILSSGNVGIGTTTSATALQVNGVVSLGKASTTIGGLAFYNATNANAVNINSGTTSAGYTLTLPTAAPTVNGQMLTGTTTGVLSWITPSSVDWSLTGNSGTSAASNFIGTTDAIDFIARTNNIERLRVLSSGNVGIGTTTPATALQVNGVASLGKASTTIGGLAFYNATNANTVNINSGTTSGGYTLTLPTAAPSANGQMLTATTAGVLSWTTPAGLTAWNLTGNSGTTAGTNFIGTTDAIDFVTKTSGTERMRVTSAGDVVVGNGDNTNSAVGGIIRATNETGGNATGSDLTLQAGNGTGSSGSGNIVFNTAAAGLPGNTVTTLTEKIRIDNAGNLGISTTAPTEKLDVAGNVKFSGALMPNNLSGTSGYLLKSNGTGTAPAWVDGNSLFWALDGNSVPSIKKFGTISNFDLPFITNNTEKMRLTAGGYLGIGTTTPEQPLHVVKYTGTGPTPDDVVDIETRNILTTVTSNPPTLNLIRQIPSALYALNVNAVSGTLSFTYRNPGSALGNDVAQIQASGMNSNGIIGFSTRTGMTNGNPATGSFTGSINISTGISYNMVLNGNVLGVGNLLGGATGLTTDANGNIIRNPSDAKLKTNVTTITNALSKVMQMRGVTYNWIDTKRFGTEKEIGFIAQELEKVVPEVVKSGGEYKSVNYNVLTALLTEAMKDQQKQIEDATAKTQSMQKTLDAQQKMIELLMQQVKELKEKVK